MVVWQVEGWFLHAAIQRRSAGVADSNALMQKAKSEKQILQNGQEVFVEQRFLCTMGLSELI